MGFSTASLCLKETNNMNFGHYTSQKGLLGIISSESLWATNIKFLNDESEFQHAIDLIKELIEKSNITDDHRDHNIYQTFIKTLKEQLASLNNYKAESVFTLSFSEETDLLSQWRGYCPDNNGYCLTLDVNAIFKNIKKTLNNVHLVKCIYDKETKEKQIKDILNESWSKYTKTKKNKTRSDIIEKLTKEIMLLASYFKHPSFSEEKEHRIVIILNYAPDNDLKFREGKFSIIPYLELPASRKYIKKVCMGPTSNKKLSRRGLEIFLDTKFSLPVIFSELELLNSKTPYRPW